MAKSSAKDAQDEPDAIMTDFREFSSSRTATHGSDFDDIRHDIYFISQKYSTKLAQSIHALSTLIRDIALLQLRGKSSKHNKAISFILSSQAANALETLKPAISRAEKLRIEYNVITHPSVKHAATSSHSYPNRLSTKALIRILALGLTRKWQPDTVVSSLLLKASYTKFLIYKESFRATLQNSRLCVLHNDFDCFSRAASSVSKRALCIQHGIPTDEFFPCHSSTQLVWGQTSKEAFIKENRNASTSILIDPLGRNSKRHLTTIDDDQNTNGILLISQSHTDIYGKSLHGSLLIFAQDLHDRCEVEGIPFKVLLHPKEITSHPYSGALKRSLQSPPHRELTRPIERHMVIGFSSSAMIDAATSGHLVYSAQFLPTHSIAAYQICRSPLILTSASDAVRTYKILRKNKQARYQADQCMKAWLANTFTEAQGYSQLDQLLSKQL